MTDILKHAKITTPFSNPDEDRATITRLTADNERLRAALEAYEKHMGKMQQVAERDLTTDRRQDQFINTMIYMLDGPELRAVQAIARAALKEEKDD